MTDPGTAQHHARARVSAEHPCLPGHFPGNPLVPGVLVIELVLEALRAWQGPQWQLRRLGSVKFLAALLPGEEMDIDLRLTGRRLDFDCRCGPRMLVQGGCDLAPD